MLFLQNITQIGVISHVFNITLVAISGAENLPESKSADYFTATLVCITEIMGRVSIAQQLALVLHAELYGVKGGKLRYDAISFSSSYWK